MLEVKGLTKKYGNELVVENLSFRVNTGEIFGLLGPNGAGKTTALKMITGLVKPDEGIITVCGFDNITNPVEMKKQIGFIPDDLNLYDYLTGREYIEFMADLWEIPSEECLECTEKLLPLLNLEYKFDHFIKTYSKGMQQKIALLGALVHKPKILILDEPLTGLDPESSKLIKDYLKGYVREGNCIIFSTHILEVAEKLCDRLLIINKGRVVGLGTLSQLRETARAGNNSLEDIFLELTRSSKDKGNNYNQ